MGPSLQFRWLGVVAAHVTELLLHPDLAELVIILVTKKSDLTKNARNQPYLEIRHTQVQDSVCLAAFLMLAACSGASLSVQTAGSQNVGDRKAIQSALRQSDFKNMSYSFTESEPRLRDTPETSQTITLKDGDYRFSRLWLSQS
jgi:hypothetical protein